jgi:hypothetical protein
MKIAGKEVFWPLRPTATARRLEVACWLAALILAMGLAPGALPTGGASPGPVVATVQFDATVFPRRCVRRVIDLTQGQSEAHIIDQLNLQCFNPIQRPPPPVSRACLRSVTWGPPVAMPRVFGCLLG